MMHISLKKHFILTNVKKKKIDFNKYLISITTMIISIKVHNYKIYIPIGSGTRQHLVDSDDVEGVHSYPHVESVFTTVLDQVLVGTDTASLQRF